MSITRRAALAAPMLALPASTAFAQTPGGRHLIIPYAAGGASDVVGRIAVEGMAARLGGNVIMEHRAGASTTIAARHVARARPDGNTLLLGTVVTFAMVPISMPDVGFDPINDFTHMTQTCEAESLIVANPRHESLEALMQAARRRPGELSYASWGVGTTAHMTMLELLRRANLDMLHVPFNGAPAALTEVISGRVDCMVILLAAGRGHAEAGRVRPLASVLPQRLAAFPQMPTVAEHGFEGFSGAGWFSVQGPPGMEPALAERIGTAVSDSFHDPANREFMQSRGLVPAERGPEALVARIRRELVVNRELMTRAGIAARS